MLKSKMTADDIIRAFDKTGLKPMRGGFYQKWPDGTECGCAITALICAKRGPEYAPNVHVFTFGEMGKELGGLSHSSVRSIICGFDGAKFTPEEIDDEYYYNIAKEASEALERSRVVAIYIEEESDEVD